MTSLHTQSGELGLIAVKGLAPSFHKGRVRFRPLRSSRRLRPLAQRVPGSHVIGGLRLVAPNCPPYAQNTLARCNKSTEPNV